VGSAFAGNPYAKLNPRALSSAVRGSGLIIELSETMSLWISSINPTGSFFCALAVSLPRCSSHRLRPSPDYSWVGSCITFFEACSAFTRVTTCRLAKSPYATFYIGGSGGFVASTAAPIATGWSDPVPGRVYLPLWFSAFHGAPQSRCYINCELVVASGFAISRRNGVEQHRPEIVAQIAAGAAPHDDWVQ